MSDANLIKDKIQEELEKGMPSKRKILSYLLDLLKKDKYPSLSDFEFYDIVGYTYNLNLDYKLSLEMLFYPIYDELKKKIKKLYGKEKKLEMEQYLSENFGLFGPEHILNSIKKEFERVDPSKDINWEVKLRTEILSFFYGLLTKEEYQHLSDSDFNYIVGETFKLNPEFFMDSLYGDLRQRMEKKNRLEMDKYIIEKYSLIDEEHIIYECNGNIKFVDSQMVKPSGGLKIMGANPAIVDITSGSIFLTNYRLIAQGILDTKGGRNWNWGLAVTVITGNSARYKALKTILESSPTYGYQFPIRNHMFLKKKGNGVSYQCIQDNQLKRIKIKLTSKASHAEREEKINSLFKILSKDVNHIKETIEVLLEMVLKDRWKNRFIYDFLEDLRVSEEYQDISDSEYLDIVRETYQLDPRFFLKSIYPKMKSWKFPSFINVKGELIELIENLNKETGQRIS
ncbi:MAG: hypothetical protein KGD61_09600 [Candidatus Lokiarchaeota archaeon]|nr:hypothetical protein [Candidatus Lokiarchaeota archaeon]